MKFPILIFNLLFYGQLSAQSVILLEQNSVSLINESVNILDNSLDFPLDLHFKNNTNENISVNWRRELGANCPLEWDIITSDQFISYTPDVHESQISLPMTPTDSNFIVRQIFLPRTVAGCCDVKMIFSLDGNPDNPIDTGYYHIEINTLECLTTSIDERDLERFTIFPNPVTTNLNFENSHLIESIDIIDSIGKIYRKNFYSNLHEIDVSFLDSGIYFCKIKNKSGKTLIQKFVKQ